MLKFIINLLPLLLIVTGLLVAALVEISLNQRFSHAPAATSRLVRRRWMYAFAVASALWLTVVVGWDVSVGELGPLAMFVTCTGWLVFDSIQAKRSE
jgi:hypothetical protein